MATTNYGLTVEFDSGIETVSFKYGSNEYIFTESGQIYGFNYEPGNNIKLTVNLKAGYSLKNSSFGNVSDNIVTIPADEMTATMSCTLTSQSSIPRLSVDVSTLAGWANLSAGSHDITIVAKAAGYKDSAPSAAVQVTKAAATKTLAAGTYKFIDAPDVSMLAFPNGVFSDFNFVSNGETFTRLLARDGHSQSANYFDILYIPAPNGWQDAGGQYSLNGKFYWRGNDEDESWVDVPAYQTITLGTDQQVSADFYEWAITGGNLVKQAVDNGITTDTPAVSYSGATFTSVSSNTSSQSQLVKQKVDAAISNGSNLQTALNSISPDIWNDLADLLPADFINSNIRIRDIGDFLFTDTDITRLVINCEAKVYCFAWYDSAGIHGTTGWVTTAASANAFDLPSAIAENGNAVAGIVMLSQVVPS